MRQWLDTIAIGLIALPILAMLAVTVLPGIDVFPILGSGIAWVLSAAYLLIPVGIFMLVLLQYGFNPRVLIYSVIAILIFEVIYYLTGGFGGLI